MISSTFTLYFTWPDIFSSEGWQRKVSLVKSFALLAPRKTILGAEASVLIRGLVQPSSFPIQEQFTSSPTANPPSASVAHERSMLENNRVIPCEATRDFHVIWLTVVPHSLFHRPNSIRGGALEDN